MDVSRTGAVAMFANTAEWAFQMLENQTLWETTARASELLTELGIDHAIVGGVAVCLHGYRRNTVDLDLLIRPADADGLRAALESAGITWNAAEKEFRTAAGVCIQIVLTGASAGPGQPATFPDPA